jgi:hypothetical protein
MTEKKVQEMQSVEIKGEYTILIQDEKRLPGQEKVSFTVHISDGPKAIVNVAFQDKLIEVDIENYSMSTELIEYLSQESYPEYKDIPVIFQKEISKAINLLSSLAINILEIINYHLQYYNISENMISIKFNGWRLNSQKWRWFPFDISIAVDVHSLPDFNKITCQYIQESINEEIIPLVGMQYLHKAKIEQINNYKWITATIAAELAVKEVLIRARPDLEKLLLELPAPPMTKLYGSILEHYLGQRTPYMKAINKGHEVRNKLIHRPSSVKIDDQEAINYVNDIERAIFHLLSLLYPKNNLIKSKVQ